jgi:dethiobiotin synthetase
MHRAHATQGERANHCEIDLTMAGLSVTGTDTGVGKTAVSCALCAALLARGYEVSAFKPVLTGLADRGPHDHDLLAALTGQTPEDVAPVRFGPAVSPHLASAIAGRDIDADALARRAHELAQAGVVVVEGAGGILAPFTADLAQGDWMAQVGLPAVVAARPGLGTINHTLLTLEAARTRGVDVQAVVLTPWPAEPTGMEVSNRETIVRLGRVDVATLSRVDLRSAQDLVAATEGWNLEAWLDA